MNLEAIRAYCLTLPHCTEDVKWGDHLCFCVGGKMFAIFGMGAEAGGSYSFKARGEDLDELLSRDGIIPAPYLARYDWVHVEGPGILRDRELREYLSRAHAVVLAKLPRKVRASLDAGVPAPKPRSRRA